MCITTEPDIPGSEQEESKQLHVAADSAVLNVLLCLT